MLLTSKYVIPITSSYIEDGGVVVQGNKIVDVGPQKSLIERYPDEEVRDYGNAAIMPGFIDLHTHLGYTALRGMFDDLPYAEWKRMVLRCEPFFTHDDWVASARLGALEGVASGITTIADITSTGSSVEATAEIGMRARIYCELITAHADHVDFAMQLGEDRLAAWGKQVNPEQISFGLAPGPIYMCHPELFRAIGDYATSKKLPVALHLAGSQEEADFIRYGFSPFSIHASLPDGGGVFPPWLPTGSTSVEYVYNWGILDAPEVLAIHCVHANDDDIKILKDHDVAIAHCPRINAKLSMGAAPLEKFIDAGLRIGLGTDSPAAIDTTDMIDEMRFGLMCRRIIDTKLHAHMSADQMLRMATIDGARALHMEDEIGSLEAGKKADIIAIDLHNSHQNPTANPQSAIIYTANQDNVKMTMVGGRVLYDDFVHVSGVDRDGIVEAANDLREHLRKVASDKTLRTEALKRASEDRRERYNR